MWCLPLNLSLHYKPLDPDRMLQMHRPTFLNNGADMWALLHPPDADADATMPALPHQHLILPHLQAVAVSIGNAAALSSPPPPPICHSAVPPPFFSLRSLARPFCTVSPTSASAVPQPPPLPSCSPQLGIQKCRRPHRVPPRYVSFPSTSGCGVIRRIQMLLA
jgi:hypothetical protein